jgi:hypothetical protein
MFAWNTVLINPVITHKIEFVLNINNNYNTNT